VCVVALAIMLPGRYVLSVHTQQIREQTLSSGGVVILQDRYVREQKSICDHSTTDVADQSSRVVGGRISPSDEALNRLWNEIYRINRI
jgi:hypothetical protein